MVNFENDLNSAQLSVVRSGDGPCLVLAGAGSGKTRTITYRVAYLLEQGVKPENILLVTFTNKAAREMIERVTRLRQGYGGQGEAGLPWSGTFHHIGYRLLKKYATFLGYKNNFSVLDSDDSLELIKLCLKQEGIDRKEKRFPSPAVLQSIISYVRNSETTIEDVLDLKYEHFLPISETLVKIAERYQQKKLLANVMDFDDLLVNWYQLLIKSPLPPFSKGGNIGGDTPLNKGGQEGVLAKLAEQFRYILVDEYQDTNKIQASIIDLLASKHKNLLVVGDDAQSIYSFRAADIDNILSFEKKYPNTKIFKLETNYRSTPEILDLANNIISNNLNQYEKNLSSIQQSFARPELHAFADQAEEAEFIAGRIEELFSEGVEPNEIAVLFRAAYHSQALEMELVKRGIDYDYRGGTRFFERAHVKDVLAYLRIINNLEDEVAWRRVLNLQVGIGPTWAERIISMVQTLHATSVQEIGAQLPAKAQIGWNDFLQVWNKLNLIENKNPGDLIAEILDSKYVEYLENEYPDYRERLQDIQQLAVFAEKAQDLNTFLAEATLQESFRRIDQNPPNPPLEKGGRGELSPPYQRGNKGDVDGSKKIILSTIHQAKGLEWEAVFVIGLSSGQFPSDRSLRERNGLEEERRLFYVATTRAKKHLHLTYSLTGGWGDMLSGPSLFIEEIDVGLLDKSEVGGGNVFGDNEIEYVDEENENNLAFISSPGREKIKKVKNSKMTGFLKSLDEL